MNSNRLDVFYFQDKKLATDRKIFSHVIYIDIDMIHIPEKKKHCMKIFEYTSKENSNMHKHI